MRIPTVQIMDLKRQIPQGFTLKKTSHRKVGTRSTQTTYIDNLIVVDTRCPHDVRTTLAGYLQAVQLELSAVGVRV